MSNVITTNYFTMFLQIIVIRASTSMDANFPSILHTHPKKKTTFSILHTNFYKTPTSVNLLYIIFYINNIFILFF